MELGELEYSQIRIDLSELLTREPQQVRSILPLENRRKNIKNPPIRPALLIALGLIGGIGLSRWEAIADSWQAFIGNKAIAQTQTQPAPTPAIQRPLEINLTISDPEDLKVKEGDTVTKGQILSDRTKERDRLTRQKTITEEAIKTLSNTQFLPPPEPQAVPPAQPLQPVDYSKEEAAIANAQLKLRQAKQAYALELEIDPFRKGLASIAAAKEEWEGAIAKSRQAGEILAAVSITNADEIEIEHRQHKLDEALREESRLEAIYKQREAELNEAKHLRDAKLAKLKDAIALAESALNQANANYASARNNRLKEEREYQEQQARRIRDANESASIFASQKAEYQNSLLRKDQQLFNLREKLENINEDISKIAKVRSRHDGVIRRIRFVNQADNTINVTLSLVPGQSANSNAGTANPFNNAPATNGGNNPFNNIPSPN